MATVETTYKWVRKFIRDGRLRYQFRRKGFPHTELKGPTSSIEFKQTYDALVAASNATALPVAPRKASGTVDTWIERYLQWAQETNAVSVSTLKHRRRILRGFADCQTPSGHRYGAQRFATMQKVNIDEALKNKPTATARDWLKALRALTRYINGAGEAPEHDPVDAITGGKLAKTDGFLAWPPEDEGDPIPRFRKHYPLGTVPRLAIELALNIAARRGDLHRIGPANLANGAITWMPSKTSRSSGRVLTIDVLPELQAALDAMPTPGKVVPTAFLVTSLGKPFASGDALGNAFADWVDDTGLQPVVCLDGKTRAYRLHGLRKASLQRLADAGATAPELMEISGHSRL